MCSFCKDKKKKSRLFSVAQFIFISRYLRKKVINTGNDYNVCELRLVEMSIQSTVQGLSSQSSCFDFIDRPNVSVFFSNGSRHVLVCFVFFQLYESVVSTESPQQRAKLHPNP